MEPSNGEPHRVDGCVPKELGALLYFNNETGVPVLAGLSVP